MPILTTSRLVQRPFADLDLDEYAQVLADPEVTRYIGDGKPVDRAGAWRQMALFAGLEVFRGWTNNAVVERSTGRLVGRCGLWQPEGWPGLEVGWLLGRDVWGRGYATEAAVAWRDWARYVKLLVFGLPLLPDSALLVAARVALQRSQARVRLVRQPPLRLPSSRDPSTVALGLRTNRSRCCW